MIFIFLSLVAAGDFYTWYISPTGSMSNNGTEESPYSMNVDEINRKMKRIGSEANYKLILMEGDYHIPGTYGLSFSNKITGNAHSIHITSQEGKRVRFIGGQQIINWTQSELYPHLWTTSLDVQISSLFVNENRATHARVPKNHKKSRTLYFTKYDDPEDSNYEIHKYWVQHDCIKLLSKLPNDELTKARITDFHGGRWNRDTIQKIDTKNDIIFTRVLKSSMPNFGVYPIKTGDMYFIDNLFPALTIEGEWYQFPNGTIYYWPKKGEKIDQIESYFSDQGIGIHTAEKDHILIENIEIYYMSSHGFYISMAENVTVRNVTVKHCGNGFSSNGKNGTIENSLFEDIGGYGGRFHSTQNVTLYNCIFRSLTRDNYDQGGIYVAVNNRDLNILNNDISGSYSAPIIISGRSSYDMETIQNITIKDNHIHHAGLNVMDDFGGVQGLAIPNGCIVDHNWIHDMNAAKSIGNGLFFGTGAAGVIMKNNLVHDISHDALKMDHGVNITLHNNIFAYANYMMTWTRYVEDTFTFNIDNNIFDSQRIYIMVGPWADSESKYYINKNIYWHQNDTSKLTWVYKTFDKWQELGNDLNSFVTDPLFVNSAKRDFNFKSDTAYKKIGFKPFSMTFGVVGEKWRKIADSFTQEEPYGTPINSPIKGSYGFEDNEDENIMKLLTVIEKGEISEEKKNEGKKSLKLESTNGIKIDKNRPNIKTTLNWIQGVGVFSMMLYLEEESWVQFDMSLGNKFMLNKGNVTFNNKFVCEFPYGKWFEFKVTVGYGDENKGIIKLEIDGENPVEVNSEYKNSPEAMLEVVNATKNVFVDKLNASLECKDLDYFDNLDYSGGDDGNNGNDKKKSNKKTVIAVVVVVVIVVAIAVGVAVFFILKKRRSNVDSDMLEQ